MSLYGMCSKDLKIISFCLELFSILLHTYISGPGSVVGIAAFYGLDGRGIKSCWGARFFLPSHTGPGAYPGSCYGHRVSIPEVKRSRCGVGHPPHLTPRLKTEYSDTFTPSGPPWFVGGWTLLCSKHLYMLVELPVKIIIFYICIECKPWNWSALVHNRLIQLSVRKGLFWCFIQPLSANPWSNFEDV
jgi:hypothetical protein